MALGLLDGLATTISFRLSSRCSEGAGPSPDAMAVDVVSSQDGRAYWTPYRRPSVTRLPARQQVWTRCWSVLSSRAILPSPPVAVCGHDADPLEERWRE